MDIAARWEAGARLLAEHRDVLEGRPDEGDVPVALERRGWATWLLALSDEALDRLEAAGHDASWPPNAPATLQALLDDARAVSVVPPRLVVPAGPARRGETPRKRAQIDAFARVVAPLAATAARVIDVGSGHGHLTRDLAERIAAPVIGLERNHALTQRARELSASASSSASPSFAITDVLRDGLALTAGDLVVGLHACGELGDAMVESVARADASLALVGCCLQKRRAASRGPLGRAGADERLDLPRALLGLSNLSAGDDGVEATRRENLAARERRLALHRLLREQLGELRLGAEIEGLNRRAAHDSLASLVARAFAVRDLAAPGPAALAWGAAGGAAPHPRPRGRRRTTRARVASRCRVRSSRARWRSSCCSTGRASWRSVASRSSYMRSSRRR